MTFRFADRCRRLEAFSHPPSPPGAIRLSGGSAYPPTMPRIVREAAEAAEAYRTEVMQYGPLYGLADLRSQVAAFDAADGGRSTAENVLITNGAKQGIDLVCRAFLEPGEAIVVSAPTYVTAVPIFIGNDANFVSVGQDMDGMRVDDLAQTLQARRAAGLPAPKLLYDIPDFHNPAGLTLSVARRRRMLELAREYDFLILEDQTYRLIRFGGEAPPSLRQLDEAGDRVIVVNTLSKLLAPGFHLGWVLAHQQILARLAALKSDNGSSPLLQRIASLVLAHGGIQQHLDEVVPELVSHRDAMLRAMRTLLPEARIGQPGGGYFLWAEFPEGFDGDELARSALDHGVVVYPGSSCFAEAPRRNAIRLSYSQASVAEIEEGVKRLAGAYREMRR